MSTAGHHITNNDETWKEQFGFISGTILVWGTILLSAWPKAAMFQTGLNAHALTFFWPSQTVNPSWGLYQVLTIPLALSISVLMFSVFHVLARGFWLGLVRTGPRSAFNKFASEFASRMADLTYSAVLALWLLAGLVLVFAGLQFLGFMFALFIKPHFSIGSRWPRVISAILIFGPTFFVGSKLFRRLRRKVTIFEGPSQLGTWLRFFILMFFFGVVGMACTEMCYTASLTVDKRLVARSKSEYIEVLVTLGGTTSDPNGASLWLTDTQTGTTKPLKLVSLGDGQYASYLLSNDLTEGHYQVQFSYPHLAIETTYPYFDSKVTHSLPITVMP